jgi:hypothetical protein
MSYQHEQSGTPVRATVLTMILGLSSAPRTIVLRFAIPEVPLRSTPGFMLSPASAGYHKIVLKCSHCSLCFARNVTKRASCRRLSKLASLSNSG